MPLSGGRCDAEQSVSRRAAAALLGGSGLATVASSTPASPWNRTSIAAGSARKHGIEAPILDTADRETVHWVIHEELVKGNVSPESRAQYLEIIDRLKARGAQGIILGCTEISMLITTGSVELPCFDTTELHAEAAVEMALT